MWEMKKISFSISVLLIFMMLFLTACSGKEKTGGSAASSGGKDTIKVGIVTSLSGPYAVIGTEVVEGIKFAAEEINADGGILGKKVEVLQEDDEGKPDVGLRKAEKLVTKDKTNFILGSVSSAVGLAIGAKMPEWNSIYISTVNKTPKLTTTNLNKNIFRANHNDLLDMELIAEYYGKELKGNYWFLIGADYEWGHSSSEGFKKIAKENGDKVIGEAYTPLGTTDYSSQITNILSANPDGIWVALSGSDGINFLKQAKSFGLTDKVKTVTFLTDTVVDAIGKDGLGVIGVSNYHNSVDFPLNKEFVANFEKKNNKKPTVYHGSAYMGAQLLFEGIKKADSAETDKVIKAMEGISYDSILGKVTLNPKDHQLQVPNFIGEVIEDSSSKSGVTQKMIYPNQ